MKWLSTNICQAISRPKSNRNNAFTCPGIHLNVDVRFSFASAPSSCIVGKMLNAAAIFFIIAFPCPFQCSVLLGNFHFGVWILTNITHTCICGMKRCWMKSAVLDAKLQLYRANTRTQRHLTRKLWHANIWNEFYLHHYGDLTLQKRLHKHSRISIEFFFFIHAKQWNQETGGGWIINKVSGEHVQFLLCTQSMRFVGIVNRFWVDEESTNSI